MKVVRNVCIDADLISLLNIYCKGAKKSRSEVFEAALKLYLINEVRKIEFWQDRAKHGVEKCQQS